ncbi:MAG TPA: serine/threonine-protein kinase [Gaiellaceae bacterium]|nr:serine/threonine-protein kinase [Gaiellaceae bacterium]
MSEELFAGRYRLLDPLGRGAMSAVWEADDVELDRRVAVKTLAPTADRQRFEREARAVAALSHPNIVALYDYGASENRPFMVLECLTGGSLEERLSSDRPPDDDETRQIAADVAAGLAHAHERGLVHRDLKPANILFDAEGRAKIADFGIARMRGTGTLTETGTVLGTASYLSPEQAAGEPAGPPSDVYSFGVILFRLLTGRLPFTATNAMELVRMHRDVAPPLVRDLRADAPGDLAALAAAALAKDPAARPADGSALVAALRGEGYESATQIIARPPRIRRLPVAAVAVAVALLVAGAALAVALTHHGGDGKSQSVPTLSLPTAGRPTTEALTTAPPTTAAEPTTTARTTTAPTTTEATTTEATTTAPTTTAPATTAPPPPTTTALPATTTIPVTTETVPTTTALPTTGETTVTTP